MISRRRLAKIIQPVTAVISVQFHSNKVNNMRQSIAVYAVHDAPRTLLLSGIVRPIEDYRRANETVEPQHGPCGSSNPEEYAEAISARQIIFIEYWLDQYLTAVLPMDSYARLIFVLSFSISTNLCTGQPQQFAVVLVVVQLCFRNCFEYSDGFECLQISNIRIRIYSKKAFLIIRARIRDFLSIRIRIHSGAKFFE